MKKKNRAISKKKEKKNNDVTEISICKVANK